MGKTVYVLVILQDILVGLLILLTTFDLYLNTKTLKDTKQPLKQPQESQSHLLLDKNIYTN